MSKKKVEPGMDTEAIITLIKLSKPPRRKEGEGVTIPEIAQQLEITKDRAKKDLVARSDLLSVQMTGSNGKPVMVFMPTEDAKNQYPDWIIKQS